MQRRFGGTQHLPTLTAVLLESSSLCLLGVLWLMRLLLRLARILSAAVAVNERSRWAGENEGTALSTTDPSMSACMLSETARARTADVAWQRRSGVLGGTRQQLAMIQAGGWPRLAGRDCWSATVADCWSASNLSRASGEQRSDLGRGDWRCKWAHDSLKERSPGARVRARCSI